MFCTKFNSKKYDISLQQFLKTFVSSNFLIFKGFKKLQNLNYTIVFVRMTFGPAGKVDESICSHFSLCSFLQNEAAKKKGTKTKEGWFFSFFIILS